MGTRESTSDEVDAQANALQSTRQRRWSALCLDLALIRPLRDIRWSLMHDRLTSKLQRVMT